MGKGDKKTKRGKIIMGSYGVRRPSKKTTRIMTETEGKTNLKKQSASIEEKEEKTKEVKKKTGKKTSTKKASVKKIEEQPDTDKTK
jgi:ribosomal small subunit protein bTHX